MKKKVTHKQESSLHCFCCGVQNEYGLHAEFFELEDGKLAALFTTGENHQSYPGRVHGGVSATILDETIGRSVMISEPGVWGVTVELSLRYKKPVPLDTPLKAVGWVTENNRRLFKGEGQLLLPDGTVAVTASGRYMKFPIEQILAGDADVTMDEELFANPKDTDPEEIDL